MNNLGLRNITSPFLIVDSAKGIITSSGSTLLNFSHASAGTYYIIVKHRNSIETWSKSGGKNLTTGINNYNLSNSITQAFGNNMKQVDALPVRFAIYSGDVNQDGTVDGTDAGLIDNDAYNFAVGYLRTDLTGDEIVEASDAAIADNNASNFVSKITP